MSQAGTKVGRLPPVFVVIVNYRGKEDTLECVRSLLKSNYPNYQIVIVDNGSGDDSVIAIRREFEGADRVVVLPSESNLGFSGGNNLGIRHSLNSGADYVFILNNDTVVAPDCIAELAAEAETASGLGIVSPLMAYFSQPDRVWFYDGYFNEALCYVRHRHRDRLITELALEAKDINFVTGCGMFIRREVLTKVGLFDPDYFLYFDDVDLSYRVRQAGYRCRTQPQARIWHKVSASAGIRGSNALSPLRAYYYGLSPFLFIAKHGTGFRKLCWLVGQFAVVIPYYLLIVAIGNPNRMPVIKSYLRGIFQGVKALLAKDSNSGQPVKTMD